MPPRRLALTRKVLAVLALLALCSTAWTGPADADFRKTQSAANKLMRTAGEKPAKLALVKTLGADESERGLTILIRWSANSRSLEAKRLAPEADKRYAAYQKYRAKVMTAGGDEPAEGTSEAKRLAKRKATWQVALTAVTSEREVRAAIAVAVRETQDPMAANWLARSGVPLLLAATSPAHLASEEGDAVLEAAFARILDRPATIARGSILAVLALPIDPELRMQGLAWIEREKLHDVAGELTACLLARTTPLRRATVRTLALLDDPRSVPLLIQAMESSTGLLATEIEALLHHFTGRTFAKDGKAWKRWWQEAGADWLKRENKKRFPPREDAGDLSFYGINTPSDRVVFVLDRSGSMKAPAVQKISNVPTTPAPDKKESAEGKTRLDIAKIELRKAITGLGTDVKFNLIFYNHKVETWKPPRALIQATAENKGGAKAWFMAQEAKGSTSLFPALMKTLDYTQDLKADGNYADPGVDTIFLLSDGAPTTFEGKLLTPEQITVAIDQFLAANVVHRCIVHTVGIGRDHNKELMKRLAAETGGTYVAVGMD